MAIIQSQERDLNSRVMDLQSTASPLSYLGIVLKYVINIIFKVYYETSKSALNKMFSKKTQTIITFKNQRKFQYK